MQRKTTILAEECGIFCGVWKQATFYMQLVFFVSYIYNFSHCSKPVAK